MDRQIYNVLFLFNFRAYKMCSVRKNPLNVILAHPKLFYCNWLWIYRKCTDQYKIILQIHFWIASFNQLFRQPSNTTKQRCLVTIESAAVVKLSCVQSVLHLAVYSSCQLLVDRPTISCFQINVVLRLKHMRKNYLWLAWKLTL